MLVTGGMAIVHYFCSRLYIILIMCITGCLFTLLRLFLPHKIHFEMIFFVPILVIVGGVYIWWVGFHCREKDESLWRAVTKPEVHGAAADGDSKAGGSSSRLNKKKSHKKKGTSGKDEG